MNTTSIANVKLSVEVITLPVSDGEQALRFYSSASRSTSTIRRTARSASCSSLHRARAVRYRSVADLRNVYLVSPTFEAARSGLLERGSKSAGSGTRPP